MTDTTHDYPKAVRDAVEALNDALADARAEGYVVVLDVTQQRKGGEVKRLNCKSITKNESY